MESILKRLNENKVITIPVQSSNIATLSYNPLQFTLTILFKKGYIYRYYNVGYMTLFKLLNKKSVGKAFMKNIYGKFKYERLNNVNQCTTEIF